MLTAGNHKLSRHILNFSLPPGVTCRRHVLCAEACYAVACYSRYPNVRTRWDENLKLSRQEAFPETMIDEIVEKRGVVVRIHVGGDFYSERYVRKWRRIAGALPSVQFYGYTKVWEFVQSTSLNELENVNIINSVLPDGTVNFGPLDEMVAKSKEFVIPICPYRRGHNDDKCGATCSLCLTEPRMLFVKH